MAAQHQACSLQEARLFEYFAECAVSLAAQAHDALGPHEGQGQKVLNANGYTCSQQL